MSGSEIFSCCAAEIVVCIVVWACGTSFLPHFVG